MTDYHNCLEQEIPQLRRYARALTRNAARADDLLDPPSANDCANRRPEAGAPPRALTFETFVRALIVAKAK